jgi:hypothetical protein
MNALVTARLMWVNAARAFQAIHVKMGGVYPLPDKWLPVSIAPSDSDLEVCVMDGHECHALVFPCRKSGTNWVDAATKKPIDIQPTHWRKWDENRA